MTFSWQKNAAKISKVPEVPRNVNPALNISSVYCLIQELVFGLHCERLSTSDVRDEKIIAKEKNAKQKKKNKGRKMGMEQAKEKAKYNNEYLTFKTLKRSKVKKKLMRIVLK